MSKKITPKVAKISINVTEFLAFSPTGSYCKTDDPKLVDDANGNVTIYAATPKTITVLKKAVDLEITILPAGSFLPVGILFAGKGNPDVHGKDNFTNRKVDLATSTIGFSDTFFTYGSKPSSVPGWEFFITLQDVNTGQLGVIDPGIENEN